MSDDFAEFGEQMFAAVKDDEYLRDAIEGFVIEYGKQRMDDLMEPYDTIRAHWGKEYDFGIRNIWQQKFWVGWVATRGTPPAP